MSENEAAEGEKRWPEVELAEGEVFDLVGWLPSEPAGCEIYVPVSSPRCLSKEEARLLIDPEKRLYPGTQMLLDRLADWAGEGTES